MAGAGQENIETMHEPEPIQTVAILWGQGRRAMKDYHGPETRLGEGAYAIKVSMSCSGVRVAYLFDSVLRTDHLFVFTCST